MREQGAGILCTYTLKDFLAVVVPLATEVQDEIRDLDVIGCMPDQSAELVICKVC